VPVPNRSSGNPIVPLYRLPTPGSRQDEAAAYTDPVTLPSADIAENPYFKRDHRRNYPRTAFYDQATIAGLLSYGSAQAPRIADGETGTKALAEVENGSLSLTQVIATSPANIVNGDILDKSGLPPVPPSLRSKAYKIVPFSQSGMFDERYPVRTFT
jgi:hypothetical protein